MLQWNLFTADLPGTDETNKLAVNSSGNSGQTSKHESNCQDLLQFTNRSERVAVNACLTGCLIARLLDCLLDCLRARVLACLRKCGRAGVRGCPIACLIACSIARVLN